MPHKTEHSSNGISKAHDESLYGKARLTLGAEDGHMLSEKTWNLLETYELAEDPTKESSSVRVGKILRFLAKVIYYLLFVVHRLLLKDIIKYFFAKPKDISKEIVLVTGGGNGLGREITYELIRRGARVAICDIDYDAARETAEVAREMKNDRNAAHAYQVDVTDIEALEDLRRKIINDFGSHVTILFNNAGILIALNFLAYSRDDLRRIMEINCLSHFWTIKTFLPDMCLNNHGHIVAIASIASYSGFEYAVPYCTSKFAVRGMTESLRCELDAINMRGVKVTCVNPTFIATRKFITDFTSTNLSPLSPREAAYQSVEAMVRDYEIVTIPSWYYGAIMLAGVYSRSCCIYVNRYVLGVKVHIDKINRYIMQGRSTPKDKLT